MDLFDLFGLMLLAATAWFWLDSLKAREMAVAAAKAACNSEHLLLLDDTVAIQRIALGRNGDGAMCIRRTYDFEYSNTGNDRSLGSIALLGSRVLVINLKLPDASEGTVIRGPWH